MYLNQIKSIFVISIFLTMTIWISNPVENTKADEIDLNENFIDDVLYDLTSIASETYWMGREHASRGEEIAKNRLMYKWDNNIAIQGKIGLADDIKIDKNIDGDGIGDTPYDISGGSNQDLYPLMHLFGPPYANFTYDNWTSVFDASLSGDYNGEIISYKWDFGDGKTGNGKIVYHEYCEVGIYDVTLTVTDDDGLTGNISKSVDVLIADIPPEVEIYGPNQGRPGIEYDYVFYLIDPESDDFYLWVDWGDGNSTGWMGPYLNGSSVKHIHMWNETGIYVIKAKVKDDCGESEWAELEVEIPRNRMSANWFFLWLLERFPLLERLLTFLL